MYFDIYPKKDKKDFFNYKREYSTVVESLKKGVPIIAIVGVRRTGKTTLMSVIFNELKDTRVWIDGRMIKDPKGEIPEAIIRAAESEEPLIFGRIDSISASIFGVEIGIKKGEEKNFDRIVGDKRIIVFIDEAQRMDVKELADLLSYFYDRYPKIQFVLSGSEVGLIDEVIEGDAISHPLYGRVIVRVDMQRLDREKSLEFLREGFKQMKVEVREEEIEEAVDTLDGLIGWLTMYGYERIMLGKRDALKITEERAVGIALSELHSFLKSRRNRKLYIDILKYAKNGIEWKVLKRALEGDYRESINPNTLTFALDELLKYSFLEKRGDQYIIADPLIFKALIRS